MVFYKGSLQYKDLQEMSWNELGNLQDYAIKINQEIKKQMERK